MAIGRKARPSMADALRELFTTRAPNRGREVNPADGRPGSIRVPGVRVGREFRDSLRARGLDPNNARDTARPTSDLPTIRAPRNPNARDERQRALAKSPLALEALRKRLTGDRVGGPVPTDDDVRRLGYLAGRSQALDLDRRRQRLRDELTGIVGTMRGLIDKGRGFAASLWDKAKAAFDSLTKDELQRGLKGLRIGTKAEAARSPMREKGFETGTPYQGRAMIAVSSSNVASVGWEPHDSEEKPRDKSLGTLFIQFRNGWLYKYVDAPHWLYQALLRAPSKGKAVWALIRRALYPDGVPYGSAAAEGYERIK